MQLEPYEPFVLARGLEDHTDSTTYYVQAVIRNAKTDALIETVNLTDQGNRRFTKTWQVPGDPSGSGFYILITYTVYTDSGYTTKASNYSERFEEHLVLHRPTDIGSGGGADVDYKRVRKIVEEVVSSELKKLPEPDKPEPLNIPFHLQPVLNALSGLRRDFKDLKLPETDFSPVEFRLESLEKAIKGIELPKTNLSPVLDAIIALEEALEPYTEKTGKDSEAMLERIRQFFSQDIEQIKKQISGVNRTLARMPFLMLGTPKPMDKEEEEIDYSQLLR